MTTRHQSSKTRRPCELAPEELRTEIGGGDQPHRIEGSFWVEASNYLQHHKVRERPAEQQREIVRRIRDLSLQLPGNSGAGDVRTLIVWLCTDRFTDCDGAAERLLAAKSTDELMADFADALRRAAVGMTNLDDATAAAVASEGDHKALFKAR